MTAPRKTLLLGVTGSIAAYKAAEVASRLTQQGVRVVVLMSAHAREFIAPLTFEALTNQPCLTGEFERLAGHRPAHTELSAAADHYLIAPCSANVLGKLAAGIGDDIVSSTALAVGCPLSVAPAMNVRMWNNPIVQRNLRALREAGVGVVEPGEGWLACGELGAGRLAEPEAILKYLREALA